MDPALKAKWVEALRSGEYQQCRTNLRHGDSYCCLGVLAEVSDLGSFVEDNHKPGIFSFAYPGEDRTHGVLPDAARLVIGLSYFHHEKCWKMNDSEGRSFAEIADYIEANIPTKDNSLAESSS